MFHLHLRPKLQHKADGPKKRTFRNPIIFAREWQTMSVKMGWSQVDIARHFGISEARVSQVFRLLKLTPEVQSTVADFGDNLTYVPVSERDLRHLVKFSADEQLEKLRTLILASKR